ncbi:hypothetical protein BGX38DRAFT_1144688 [Terfezia claveryi]|nr:hypothetical protein BGX38DRAFT_1144688 [Terfezia claveryi]
MHTASVLPSTPHYRVYCHLSLTTPSPPYYLLDFRPGTAGSEVTDTNSISCSIAWGRVYALPLSTYNPAIWNSTITDGLSELDILVLMRTLEVINEESPGGVRWVMKGKRDEGGVFKIMLEKVELRVSGTPGSSIRGITPVEELVQKDGLVMYLLVVPEREEYILRRKEREGEDIAIELVAMTGEPISHPSSPWKQQGTSFEKGRLALLDGKLGTLLATGGIIAAFIYMGAGFIQAANDSMPACTCDIILC